MFKSVALINIAVESAGNQLGLLSVVVFATAGASDVVFGGKNVTRELAPPQNQQQTDSKLDDGAARTV